MANNAILGAMLLLIKTKADTSGLNKTDKALRKTGGAIKSISKDIGLIGKLSKGFLAYLGARGIGGVFNNYLQFEKDLGAMKSRFYAITKSDVLANEEFEYIRKLATDTANDIKSVADSYSIFYAAANRPLGKDGARSIFEQWTKIGRVLHLSEAQFERVTYALREMSSKGQLYSQDLKIQLGTHVPDAINIAEEAIKSLGIAGVTTVDEFQKYTKANQKSNLMPRFLMAFSKVASQRYGSEEALKKALQQPDAIVGAIKNIKTNFLIEFSKAGGGYAIVKILEGVKNTLLSIDYELVAKISGTITKILSTTAHFLPLIFNILSKMLVFFIAFRINKMILNFSKFMATFNRAKKILEKFGSLEKQIRFVTKFYGKESTMSKILTSALKSAGTKIGLRTIIAGALSTTMGPIGILLSSLGFLPEIFSIMRWIAKKLGWNDKSKYVGEYIGDSGIKTATALNVIKKLNEKGIQSGPELDRQLGYYGVKGLAKYIAWDSHDQIVIRLDNGEYIDEDELASLIARKVDATNMDENKPKTPRPIISKKGAWGRGY